MGDEKMSDEKLGPGIIRKAPAGKGASVKTRAAKTGKIPSWAKVAIPCAAAAAAIVLIILSLNGTISAGGPSAGSDTNGVRVPDVVGIHFEEAIIETEKVDLLLIITGKENSDTVESNLILSQNPRARARVAAGSALLVIVSGGEALQVAPGGVPNVLFLPEEEAMAILDAAGIEYKIVYAESQNVLDGLVMSQSEGKTPVEIVVSKGSGGQDAALEDGGYEDLSGRVAGNRNRREEREAANKMAESGEESEQNGQGQAPEPAPAPALVITITKQPSGGTMYLYQYYILSIEAEATEEAELTFQWYNGDGLPMDGGTESVYNTPSNLPLGSHSFYCEVSVEGAEPVMSDTALVKVIERPPEPEPEPPSSGGGGGGSRPSPPPRPVSGG